MHSDFEKNFLKNFAKQTNICDTPFFVFKRLPNVSKNHHLVELSKQLPNYFYNLASFFSSFIETSVFLGKTIFLLTK